MNHSEEPLGGLQVQVPAGHDGLPQTTRDMDGRFGY